MSQEKQSCALPTAVSAHPGSPPCRPQRSELATCAQLLQMVVSSPNAQRLLRQQQHKTNHHQIQKESHPPPPPGGLLLLISSLFDSTQWLLRISVRSLEAALLSIADVRGNAALRLRRATVCAMPDKCKMSLRGRDLETLGSKHSFITDKTILGLGLSVFYPL